MEQLYKALATSNETPRVPPRVIQIAPRPPSLPPTGQPPSTWTAHFHTATTTMRQGEGAVAANLPGTTAEDARAGRRRGESASFSPRQTSVVTRSGLVLSPVATYVALACWRLRLAFRSVRPAGPTESNPFLSGHKSPA
jgi:hypothetical protein